MPKPLKTKFQRRTPRPVMFTDAEWDEVKGLTEKKQWTLDQRTLSISGFLRLLVKEESIRIGGEIK